MSSVAKEAAYRKTLKVRKGEAGRVAVNAEDRRIAEFESPPLLTYKELNRMNGPQIVCSGCGEPCSMLWPWCDKCQEQFNALCNSLPPETCGAVLDIDGKTLYCSLPVGHGENHFFPDLSAKS